MKTTRNRLFFVAVLFALAGCRERQQTPPAVTITLVVPTPMIVEAKTATPPVPTEVPTQTPSATPSETPTATPQETQTLMAGKTCQPDQDQIQVVLQAAIPQKFWGLHYQTNGVHSPSMDLFGVTSGETKTLAVEGKPGNSESLDLARLYFLNADGSLDILWAALGMTSLVNTVLTPASYYSFNDLDQLGWHSSEEARATFSRPGQVFVITISDWYVYPDGIRWEECPRNGQNTSATICNLGLVLDKGGSAQFLSTGVPPEDWFAFGWNEFPNSMNSYSFPFPDAVTFPGATCP